MGGGGPGCWGFSELSWPGVVLGDLVVVAGWEIVPCVSKTDTLGGEWGWVCLVETWTVVKTILNTR